MGQEIVYCFQCQGRILGADFERGQAYQLGQRFVCSPCAAAVLPTLPIKERERLMAEMFKATRDRRSTSSGAHAAIRTPPAPDRGMEGRKTTGRIPIVKRPAPSPIQPALSPLWAVGAAAFAALVLIGWALSGNRTSTPSVADLPAPPPRPAPPTVAPPPDPRTAAARDAMARAEAFAASHPKDVDGAVAQWEAAVKASEGTGYSRDAVLKLGNAARRRTEAYDRELAELEAQVKAPLAAEDYRKAADLYKAAAPRHAHPDWSFALEKRAGEVFQTASRQLATLKEKPAELKDLRARVEKWGYPELLADYTQTVQRLAAEGPAWTSMLHGAWIEKLVKDNCGWAWDGDALVITKDNPRPARTFEDYESGEFRVRFEAVGTTYAFFNVRQADAGAFMVQILRPVFESLPPGEHVLVITFRGPTVTATLDGKPTTVETVRRPTTGAIQFCPGNGKFRVNSLEYRP
ncbi:MAG: hypothetical protein JO332_02865 [Planctomycetaceae bacterium]|nr:hypothetical protein [Planctomycetaceae bacterium]